VRNAGRKLVRVLDQAKALDGLLRDQAGGERIASPPRFSAKPDGRIWRITPMRGEAFAPPLWFKFLTQTGEVQAAKDALQYVPHGRGRHAITIIAVDPAGGTAREDLAFSDAAAGRLAGSRL
jgi:hypothetical protein